MAWGGSKAWVISDTVGQPDVELNRIEANIESIILGLTHVTWPTLTYKKDRVETSFLSVAEIQNIDNNCLAISNKLGSGFIQRTFASGGAITYADLNRWEALTALLHQVALLLPGQLLYCGTFYCGEDGVIY